MKDQEVRLIQYLCLNAGLTFEETKEATGATRSDVQMALEEPNLVSPEPPNAELQRRAQKIVKRMKGRLFLWKWWWIAATFPVFLLLVPVATVVSIFDRRDVFPAAHYWTHGIFFGHRWVRYLGVSQDWRWETCSFCGKMKVAQKK